MIRHQVGRPRALPGFIHLRQGFGLFFITCLGQAATLYYDARAIGGPSIFCHDDAARRDVRCTALITLELDVEREAAIIAMLEHYGYTCTRDETLTRQAVGRYGFTARGGAEADSAGVRLDEAAVGHLLRALSDADTGLRAYAAYVLRHVARREPRVREALTTALHDEDAVVRRYAAESLQAGGQG
jgi:hypothetical protein